METSVTKLMDFEYGHRILNHPGKCKRLHGHSGRVEFTLWGEIDQETGMVIDFGDIKSTVGDYLKNTLDHKTILQQGDSLKETLPPQDTVVIEGPPTAENISKMILVHSAPIFQGQRMSVKLWETSDSYAQCSL